MRVASEISNLFPDDPARHLGFEKFESECGNFTLCVGSSNFEKLKTSDGERIVVVDFEEPNRYWVPTDTTTQYQDRFERILTLCPFTTEWQNQREGRDRRQSIFFPFNGDYIPRKATKRFDAIYMGGAHAAPIERVLRAISRFNYKFVTRDKHALATDSDIPYLEKLRLVSETRVTVVHNLLFVTRPQLKNLWRVSGYQSNRAFTQVPRPASRLAFWRKRDAIVPQLKSRVFEAAFCRSLILCLRDPWNVIERYFEPDREFVYFDDGNLEEVLRTILNDYDHYVAVMDRAFERASREYTTKSFVDRYLSDL